MCVCVRMWWFYHVCIYVNWIASTSTIFDLHTCVQTYLNKHVVIWLGTQKCLTFMLHFMHLALIFNHLEYLGARERKRSGLGRLALWNVSLPLSLSVSLYVFLVLISAFFFPPLLFTLYRSPFSCTVSSSPTHTFRNITEHHNNSYQVPVCSMIYSRYPCEVWLLWSLC